MNLTFTKERYFDFLELRIITCLLSVLNFGGLDSLKSRRIGFSSSGICVLLLFSHLTGWENDLIGGWDVARFVSRLLSDVDDLSDLELTTEN